MQADHLPLERTGAATHGHQLALQLLEDADRVAGQVRELAEHRAQREAAHVHQVHEAGAWCARGAVLPPSSSAAHIFRKYRPLAERHRLWRRVGRRAELQNSRDWLTDGRTRADYYTSVGGDARIPRRTAATPVRWRMWCVRGSCASRAVIVGDFFFSPREGGMSTG